jgi:hypothetical protein
MEYDLVIDEPVEHRLNQLAYFVSEREAIRLQKAEGKPAPWTSDVVLGHYRFCNVRRKHDRVSEWVIENIIKPYEGNSHLWFMLACARWVNWPPTLQALMDAGLWPEEHFDADAFGDLIDRRVQHGQKTWTGAYLITARQLPEGVGKGRWIANNMLLPLTEREDIEFYFDDSYPETRTVRGALAKFEGEYGWGTFMTGQVVADLTYTRALKDAPDLRTYAPIGPGSTRGLNRMFERALDQRISQDRFNQELMLTLELVNKRLGGALDDLTLHDWQNCFCEFDKYLRALNGGRPRANYQPETRF